MSFGTWMKSTSQYLRRRLHFISLGVLFFIGLYLQINFVFKQNLLFGLVLLNVGIFSLFVIMPFWKWFSNQFAPWIVDFANVNFIGRKLIAGGSFSYFEYADDEEEVGIGAPFGRFVSLLIAFLGLSTTLIKIGSSINENITLDSPVASANSMTTWAFLLVLVPVLLTPIIPIIWAMEDLRIKAWDKKKGVNWRVADKYRVKFNSFIAIGAVTAGLSLTGTEGADPLSNALVFLGLVGYGVTLLVLPLSLMTILYYLQFRGNVRNKVKKRINLPTLLTELIDDVPKYRNMEKELEELKKRVRKYEKKEEYQKKGGFLGKLGLVKPQASPDDVESDAEEAETTDEETIEEETSSNKFISNDKITDENYSELEEKYFGETSGRSLTPKKKKKESPLEKPAKAIKGAVNGVNSFVGGIFKKKDKKEKED